MLHTKPEMHESGFGAAQNRKWSQTGNRNRKRLSPAPYHAPKPGTNTGNDSTPPYTGSEQSKAGFGPPPLMWVMCVWAITRKRF